MTELPFLRAPLPQSFRRRHVVVRPGAPHPYVAAEWRDTLVVVEQGALDLECRRGGVRRFATGAVLHLDGLALRALHSPGPDPTVLITVTRRRTVEPRIVDLPERPYLGVRATCTEMTMNVVADRIPEIIGHVLGHGGTIAGAPFIRYHRIGGDGELDAEAGVPVDDPALATDAVPAGALPAGRYAVARHVGHYDGLAAATVDLLAWAGDLGLAWDRTGERWGCRTEHFLTHLAEEPDPSRYETEVALRLAD